MRFQWCFAILCIQILFVSSRSLLHGNHAEMKTLTVGEELVGEMLPLKSGRRFFRLSGLKESAWYEVKISYPASIPASFDIQLARDVSEMSLGKSRRLLNTEKLIFVADGSKLKSGRNEMYALVTVEAAGVVAKPGVQERDFILFNIVCDELLLGIPHKAWWVVLAVIFCMVVALIIPYYLPFHLLLKDGNQAVAKVS